jgi:hypothetical protein
MASDVLHDIEVGTTERFTAETPIGVFHGVENYTTLLKSY